LPRSAGLRSSRERITRRSPTRRDRAQVPPSRGGRGRSLSSRRRARGLRADHTGSLDPARGPLSRHGRRRHGPGRLRLPAAPDREGHDGLGQVDRASARRFGLPSARRARGPGRPDGRPARLAALRAEDPALVVSTGSKLESALAAVRATSGRRGRKPAIPLPDIEPDERPTGKRTGASIDQPVSSGTELSEAAMSAEVETSPAAATDPGLDKAARGPASGSGGTAKAAEATEP